MSFSSWDFLSSLVEKMIYLFFYYYYFFKCHVGEKLDISHKLNFCCAFEIFHKENRILEKKKKKKLMTIEYVGLTCRHKI